MFSACTPGPSCFPTASQTWSGWTTGEAPETRPFFRHRTCYFPSNLGQNPHAELCSGKAASPHPIPTSLPASSTPLSMTNDRDSDLIKRMRVIRAATWARPAQTGILWPNGLRTWLASPPGSRAARRGLLGITFRVRT